MVAVAQKLCAHWQEFVSVLAPFLFQWTNRGDKNENNDDFFSQCRTALDMWMKEFGTEAKQQSVIQTMCDIEQRAHAVN